MRHVSKSVILSESVTRGFCFDLDKDVEIGAGWLFSGQGFAFALQ